MYCNVYVYIYKVQVSDVHAFGEAFVNITVRKPVRINTPPVAVISPKHQEITLPIDNTVLDGAGKLLHTNALHKFLII